MSARALSRPAGDDGAREAVRGLRGSGRRRRLSDAERQARSSQMILAWQEGRFANRRKARHPRHWTPDQDDALRTLAGTMPVEEIAEELERRFYLTRTVPSLRIRAKRLGISLWQGGYSLREIESIFGTPHHTISPLWIEAGHLKGYRWKARGPNPGWWFERSEAERFVRECGWLYHLDKMRPGHPLTKLAQITHRAEPWIAGTYAVARVLGLSQARVCKWLKRGLIPHRRRPAGGGIGMVMVRGRDVPAIREAISRAQDDGVERSREHFRRVLQRPAERQSA
jgi:hypothetical protein